MSNEDLTADRVQEPAFVETTSRQQFIAKVYMHLIGAIVAFGALEYALLQSEYAPVVAAYMLEGWLGVLGAFILVSWGASHVAHRVESKPKQYMALAGFVVAEAIIFMPLMYIAMMVGPEIIEKAVGVTVVAFAALSMVAVMSGRDFSFLRSFLIWGGVIALGTIVMGTVIGFHLGTYFSMAMIGFAGAAILYDTSKIIKTYPDDRYIAGALELFASFALMLWYVLRFFLSRR